MSELNYADIPDSVRIAFLRYEAAFKLDGELEDQWYYNRDKGEADCLRVAYEAFHDVEQDRGLKFHCACEEAGIDAEQVEGVILDARFNGR